MTTEVSEPRATAPKRNLFSRIAGVLFAPADAFEEIVRKPDVLAPLLLFVGISYAGTAVLMPRFDYEALKTYTIEQNQKARPGTSAADLDRIARFSAAGAKVFGWLGPLLMVFVVA